MKKLWWVAVALAVSAVLNAVAAMAGRGSYAYVTLTIKCIAMVGAPTFVASIVLMISGREKRPRLFLAGYALNLASMVIGLMVVSGFIGLFIAAGDVKDARMYCDMLIPRLETYKEQSGHYPADVNAVSTGQCEPRLLTGSRFYIPQSDGYVMEFRDPSARQKIVRYCSWENHWQIHR
jgi:hypothetical protein